MRAHSSKTLYSEIDSTGGCGMLVHPLYQRIQLKPFHGPWTQFSLGLDKDRGGFLQNNATGEFQYHAPTPGDIISRHTFRASIFIANDGTIQFSMDN